jgi:predicted nuclease with TOPRIM domain
MTDEQLLEQFHRLELRLERFETRLEALDKRLSDSTQEVRAGLTDVRSELRTRVEGLESRLNTKAGTWAVTLWGATLAILVSAVGVGLGLLIQRHP